MIEFVYYAYQEFSPVVIHYYQEAVEVVESSDISDFKSEQTSYIYNANGKQIAKLKTDRDVNYVYYSEIPEQIINATVAIEDKRFWEHEGVDLLSTSKAAFLYLKDSENIVRGGSTITQQLTKNIYLTFEKSLQRKLKEIFIAFRLEKRYTKGQILEFYLNNINYANGYYGIGAAAKGYFNKTLKELTLEEVAFLAAIPNNPSLYDPVSHTKNTTKRRNLILKEMWQQGYITEDEYWKASNSPIHFYQPKAKEYNYETSYAINCATQAIMKRQGFSFQYSFDTMKEYRKYLKKYADAFQSAKDLLYVSGFRVYTTIDPKVQKELQKSIDSVLKDFHEKKDGVYRMQGAATVIDNATGNVIAVVGGRSQKFGGILTLNRAYQSYRQPGSTFKPLAVYTPTFEQGKITPTTLVDDSYFEGGPYNSGDSYDGEITVRKAVEKSKNVIAWKLFDKLGPEHALEYVQRMRFSKIVPDDYYLSSALGGLTYGVTTVEMAGGYASLANDGIFREPTCIRKITDADGMQIDFERETYRIYSEHAARTMTDVLQGVKKRGTARGLTVGKMPIACKTGTTNNQTNGWFCGYTPYYTVACYVGEDLNRPVSSLWGNTYPMQIWQRIQTYLCEGKKVIHFKKPEDHKSKTDKKTEKKEEPPEPPITSAEEPDSVSQPENDSWMWQSSNSSEQTKEENPVKEEFIPKSNDSEQEGDDGDEDSENEMEEFVPEIDQDDEDENAPVDDNGREDATDSGDEILSMYAPSEELEEGVDDTSDDNLEENMDDASDDNLEEDMNDVSDDNSEEEKPPEEYTENSAEIQ